jgi:hypothetical protein
MSSAQPEKNAKENYIRIYLEHHQTFYSFRTTHNNAPLVASSPLQQYLKPTILGCGVRTQIMMQKRTESASKQLKNANI